MMNGCDGAVYSAGFGSVAGNSRDMVSLIHWQIMIIFFVTTASLKDLAIIEV